MTNILKKFGILISEATDEKYEDVTIAIAAGSFKPPHRGHWNMIETLSKEADMTKVFISNLTLDLIMSRPIKAKGIKEEIANIKKLLKKDAFSDADGKKRVDIVFDKVDKLSGDDFNWMNVKDALLLTDAEIGKSSIMQKRIEKIQDHIFSSLAKHSLDGTYHTTLTPDISKEILDIYASHSDANIEILLADGDYKEYPMIAAIVWVAEHCKNCRIILGSSDKDRDNNNRWKTLDIDLTGNDKNGNHFDIKNIKTFYVMNQILSSEYIRQSIQNGEWSNEWVPESLTPEEIEEVKELILQVSKKDDTDEYI